MNLFEVQPKECREPLPQKLLSSNLRDCYIRVLYFDPTPVYERIGHLIDPYKRIQSICIERMFPNEDKRVCACGCGVFLEGRRTRWANDGCSEFGRCVSGIISGNSQMIRSFLYDYYGYVCFKCDEHESMLISLEADHTIGVKHGGGGSWLSNYKYLCKGCHREKTNEDFGWNKK